MTVLQKNKIIKRHIGRPSIEEKKKIPFDARRKLFDAALSLFAEKGYSATSVREIVKRAGVTMPLLYYYFKNKEGIFFGLMEEASRQMYELILDTVSSKGRVTKRIVKLFENIVRMQKERINLVKFIYSIFYGPPQGIPVFNVQQFPRRIRKVLKDLLLEGIERGELKRIRNIEEVVWALNGVLKITLEAQICSDKDAPGRLKMKRMVGIVLNNYLNKVGNKE